MQLQGIPKECSELSLLEVAASLKNFVLELECSSKQPIIEIQLPKIKVLGLKRNALDNFYLPVLHIDGNKVNVDISDPNGKWLDIGQVTLGKGKHYVDIKNDTYYKFKTLVFETDSTNNFPVDENNQFVSRKTLNKFRPFDFKLFFIAAIVCGAYIYRTKLGKWVSNLWYALYKIFAKKYFSLPDKAWATIWFFIGIGFYVLGMQQKITEQNYEITFAGIFIVLFLWHISVVIKSWLFKRSIRIGEYVYHSSYSPFFAWSVVLIILTIFLIVVKLDLLAEQIGLIIYYLLIAGTISEYVTKRMNAKVEQEFDDSSVIVSNGQQIDGNFEKRNITRKNIYNNEKYDFLIKKIIKKIETFFNLKLLEKTKFGRHVMPIALVILFCIIFCSPILFSLNSAVPSEGDNNGFLNEISMINRWVKYEEPVYINSYVGYPNNKETYVPSSPLGIIISYIISLVSTKTIALNINLFLSFVFTAIITYALAYRILPDRFYSSLVSLFFLFSPLHWSVLPAISMIWCVPLIIFCFLKYKNNEKFSSFYLCIAILLTCFIGLYQYFYFSFLFVIFFGFYLFIKNIINCYKTKQKIVNSIDKTLLRYFIISCISLLIGLSPYIIPIIKYVNEPVLQNTMNDFTSSHFGSWNSELLGYITPYFYRGGYKYSITPFNFFPFFPKTACPNNYLGIVSLIMAICGFYCFRKEIKNYKLYIMIFVFFFILSLGTYLKISSKYEINGLLLPYYIFKFIPGFGFLRAPGRLAISAALIISIFAPLIIVRLYKNKKYIGLILAIIFFLLDSRFIYHFPFDKNKIYRPAVYEDLIADDDECKSVIQLPFISFSPNGYLRHAIDIGKSSISPLSQRPLPDSHKFVQNLDYLNVFYQPDKLIGDDSEKKPLFIVEGNKLKRLKDKLSKHKINYIILHKYYFNMRDQLIYDPKKKTKMIQKHYSTLKMLFDEPIHEDELTVLFYNQN
jgi:hypothetical protein